MDFVMKVIWLILFIPDKKFEDCINLLLTTDENKSHYVCIKNFYKFLFNKTKNNVYNVLVVKKIYWNMKMFA